MRFWLLISLLVVLLLVSCTSFLHDEMDDSAYIPFPEPHNEGGGNSV